MKTLFYIIFIIAVLAVGLIFTIYNSSIVQFHYIVDSVSLPLSVIIIVAVILGATLGLLASSIIVIRTRAELAKLKKNVKKSGSE